MLVEKLLGATSVCALVTGMAAVNDQTRYVVTGLMRGELIQNVGLPVSRAVALAKGATSSFLELTGDNMVITGFGVGALVLVGLMRRT
jgi:hypothetical protein